MAFVALTSLIQTIELQFLQPIPRVRLSLHDHDQAGINSFLENLSSLKATLQQEFSGDGDGDALKLRDIEIEIRDFALKAEDDIELQLSNILLAHQHGGGEYGEKAAACHQLLHQTLQEAAKYATELWESSKMGSATVALTILIKKIKHYFPMVYRCDHGTAMKMEHFSQHLSTLRGCLLQERSSNNTGAAIKILETNIRNFALKTEDDLQIQLKNFLLAKHTGHQEKASQKLHHTLQEAAESARELWNIIITGNEVDEANQTQPSNTWLRHTSAANVESDGSTLHGFLKLEGRMVGRHRDCTLIVGLGFPPMW